jgi:hypothetical protein
MENETKKVDLDSRKKIIIIGAVALILIVVIVLLVTTNKPKTNTTTNPTNTQTQTGTDITSDQIPTDKGTTTVVDKYRTEVPANIVVPDQNTQLSEAEKKVTAIPTVVTAAAPGVEAQFRSFDIKAEGGVFTPSKIIARVGDTVHVNFTAVDKDYDIVFPSYNMKQSAKKGQTKILEFQAVTEGSFLYYCNACGGETSNTKGNIIVAK